MCKVLMTVMWQAARCTMQSNRNRTTYIGWVQLFPVLLDIHNITEYLNWFSNYQLLKSDHSVSVIRMLIQFPTQITIVTLTSWLAAV